MNPSRQAPNPASKPLGPGPRTRVVRRKERASYDRDAVYALIDEALYCHVAFSLDGDARVLPTVHARIGDRIYLHGAAANRMLDALVQAGSCSLAFTLLDGLVFARTAVHHSMNYRSVVAFGDVRPVNDDETKQRALARLLDHTAPGRSGEVPPPEPHELRATRVVEVTLTEASLKRRDAPANDTEDAIADRSRYAGVLPLVTRAAAPARNPDLATEVVLSKAVAARAQTFGTELLREQTKGSALFSDDPSRLDFQFIHRFLAEDSYWAKGIEPERLRRALSNSLCFGVYLDGAQVGFGRAVTDQTRFAYLADIFIAEPHRGRGLGTALVEFMLSHPALRDATRITLGTRDAHRLYQRFGFEPRPGIDVMARERK